jgi:hypothetical protein
MQVRRTRAAHAAQCCGMPDSRVWVVRCAGATAQVHAVALLLARLERHADAQLCATLAGALPPRFCSARRRMP